MPVARGVNKEGHHASIPNHRRPPPRPKTARSYAQVAMFGMGFGELLVVLVVVLLVFGPGRLPEMMGNLGKAMREFQKGAARAAGD